MQGSEAASAASGGYGELVLTTLLVLALVCGAAWVAVRLLGRWLEGRRIGGGVAVTARVPLEPRRTLYVVEAGGRTLLLGSSEMGVTLVAELDPAAMAAAAAAEPAPRGFARGFGDVLAQALARRRGEARRRPGAGGDGGGGGAGEAGAGGSGDDGEDRP